MESVLGTGTGVDGHHYNATVRAVVRHSNGPECRLADRLDRSHTRVAAHLRYHRIAVRVRNVFAISLLRHRRVS